MNTTNLPLEEEIKKLYWAHYRELCLQAISIIADVETAHDMVQEFFINYWERRGQGIDAPDNFIGYARRAVRNICIDHIRRKEVEERRQQQLPEIEKYVNPYVEEEEAQRYYTRLKRVFELIDALPKGQRAILKLHALEKLTYAQIAKKQGVSINTVRTQLTRAYTKMRKSSSGLVLLSLLKYI